MTLGYYFIEPNFFLVEVPIDDLEKLNNRFIKRGDIVKIPENHRVLGKYSYSEAWGWLLEIRGRMESITANAPSGKESMLVAKVR